MAGNSAHRPGQKDHDVKTSWVHRTSIGFARTVSDVERASCEAHFLAGEFLTDATALGGALGTENGAPVYVLYIHAIEMALKSYLLRRGVTEQQLKRMGHDLPDLLNQARARGLMTNDPDTDHIITELGKATHKAAIRYDMPYQMPMPKDVRDVAVAIIELTAPPTPMPGDGGGP